MPHDCTNMPHVYRNKPHVYRNYLHTDNRSRNDHPLRPSSFFIHQPSLIPSSLIAGLSVPHSGQGMGAEKTVAFHSISIALNTCPHFGHLNDVVPRTMIKMFFLLLFNSLLHGNLSLGTSLIEGDGTEVYVVQCPLQALHLRQIDADGRVVTPGHSVR